MCMDISKTEKSSLLKIQNKIDSIMLGQVRLGKVRFKFG